VIHRASNRRLAKRAPIVHIQRRTSTRQPRSRRVRSSRSRACARSPGSLASGDDPPPEPELSRAAGAAA
jgi:hypothetical protein